MKPSPKFTLNNRDWETWGRNVLIFLAPLGLTYLAPVTVALQAAGHSVSMKDFLPSSFTLGAMVLYVVNAITDLIRKLLDGKAAK